MTTPRAGIVTIAGRPNAGKSTLLNRLIGERLSITSAKPQTTRARIVGIRSDERTQMVFLDTPGLLEAEYELHARMRATAIAALRDADVVLHVTDATEGVPPTLEELAGLQAPPTAHVQLVLNKCDLLSEEARRALSEARPAGLLLSATTGEGVDQLVGDVAKRLPEHPFLYPADELSTQPMRFFAAEMVREAALAQLGDEVPYAVACIVEEFREDRSPVYIRATLYVERDSQKRILIGANGARIRNIGTAARQRIEALVGGPVYLDLWVKVEPHWRREPHVLDRLGYRLPS